MGRDSTARQAWVRAEERATRAAACGTDEELIAAAQAADDALRARLAEADEQARHDAR